MFSQFRGKCFLLLKPSLSAREQMNGKMSSSSLNPKEELTKEILGNTGSWVIATHLDFSNPYSFAALYHRPQILQTMNSGRSKTLKFEISKVYTNRLQRLNSLTIFLVSDDFTASSMSCGLG